ncbi:hypothetical protein E306M_06480 [Moorella sp. E306M]|nr:hypothetical protein E306M_06480 [Moorella sp. E306M]
MIEYIAKWAEHFFVLPVRWFRIHYRNWRELRQRCKVCGCRDKFDFDVPDEVWQAVVPPKYQNRVVCLACFDDFAKKKEVDYSASIQELYFAGDKAGLTFRKV